MGIQPGLELGFPDFWFVVCSIMVERRKEEIIVCLSVGLCFKNFKIPIAAPWGKYYDYSQFTDEETKTQRSEVTVEVPQWS